MESFLGASSSVSDLSSPQSVMVGTAGAFIGKHVNIPTFCKIKVVVVEYHNEALRYIYRSIGAKKVPFDGLKLLHIDSHPDLCIPNIHPSKILSKPYEMLKFVVNGSGSFRYTGIENWIFPAVFGRHINHVIWLHPPWSKQLTNRRPTRYFIGKCKSSETLTVNIPEAYFYNEGIYAHRKDMESSVPFTLTVGTIHESNTMCSACTDITSALINEAFILDVDLDAFSTRDPFRDSYSAEQFALIDKLFTAPRPPPLGLLPDTSEVDASTVTSAEAEVVFESASLAAKVVCEEHKAHLSTLWRCMRTLATGVPIVNEEGVSSICDSHEMLALATLLLSLPQGTFSTCVHAAIQATHSAALFSIQQYSGTDSSPRIAPNEDLSELDEIGQLRLSHCGLSPKSCSPEPPKEKQQRVDSDDPGDYEKTDLAMMACLHDLWKSLADRENYPLPHYVSSTQEQEELVAGLESLLNRLHNPCLITVARSVEDGYTPAEQIADLQLRFFKALQRIYGTAMLSVVLDYDGATVDASALRSMGLEVIEARGEAHPP